jgi:hypothetical protein
MLSTKQSKSSQTTDTKWDKAILDAEEELRIAEKRVGRLRTAIRIFRDHKNSGVPWPGDGRFIGQDSD